MVSQWVILLFLYTTTNVSFSIATTIIDRCPGIGVQSIRRESQQYELSFIFYFTSWSNSSLEVRKIYNEVAQYYDNYYFAEIDCWHLACNCTKTHEGGSGLPDSWPTLIIRFGNSIKMQYHGEWTFIDLIRFINNLHQPIKRVQKRSELKLLTLKSDAVVLGLFPNADTKDYKQFVIAALQWLQIDPHLSFRFAVTFGKSCQHFLKKSNAITPMLLLINNIKIDNYDQKKNFNASEIIQWVQNELKRSYNNVSGYNTPATLSLHAKKSEPILAIFANEYHSRKNFYTQMQQFVNTIASNTYNKPICKQTQNIFNKLHWQLDIDKFFNKKEMLSISKSTCLHYQFIDIEILQNYYHFNKYWNKMWDLSNANSIFHYEFGTSSSDNLLKLYKRNMCLGNDKAISTVQLKTSITKYLKKSCELLRLASPINGHNQTLSVVILNKAKYKDFLEQQIGISTLQQHYAAVVIIFDTKHETSYVMQDYFTPESFELFIANYYSKNLSSLKKIDTNIENNTNKQHFRGNEISITYLENYNADVLFNRSVDENVTTVLLLESPLCALSGIMSHSLTQVAALLRDSNKELRFFKLNTFTNNLPWSFVMPSSPALIVLPNGNSMESRVFPNYLKPDVRNIMGFILAQLKPVQQVSAMMQSCRRYKLIPYKQHKCLEYSRSLLMQHIGHYLKQWQIYENHREYILSHLKSFKDLGLDIQHSFRF